MKGFVLFVTPLRDRMSGIHVAKTKEKTAKGNQVLVWLEIFILKLSLLKVNHHYKV